MGQQGLPDLPDPLVRRVPGDPLDGDNWPPWIEIWHSALVAAEPLVHYWHALCS